MRFFSVLSLRFAIQNSCFAYFYNERILSKADAFYALICRWNRYFVQGTPLAAQIQRSSRENFSLFYRKSEANYSTLTFKLVNFQRSTSITKSKRQLQIQTAKRAQLLHVWTTKSIVDTRKQRILVHSSRPAAISTDYWSYKMRQDTIHPSTESELSCKHCVR